MKTEGRLQQNCVVWMHNTHPQYRSLFFEINNTSENAREGMRHRCLGRVKGVADTCLLVPGGKPIFLEFKTPEGKQSPAQAEWESRIRLAGYNYEIVRTEEEFRGIITKYMKI
jgi:hypothetical protein